MSIKVTERIAFDAVTKGVKINDIMADQYRDEIAQKIKSDEKFKSLTPIEMAMVDAGLTKKSLIKDFTTSENELLFPAIVDTRVAELVSANPFLEKIIGATQEVTGLSASGLKIDLSTDANKAALALKDVAEGADLPTTTISTCKHGITLFKRGTAVQITYETLMYCKLELFMRTLNYISAYSANQQIKDAIDVVVNGDGNSNAAIADTASGASFVTADIVKFAIDFAKANNYLYNLDTIICNSTIGNQLFNMTVSNNVDLGFRLGVGFDFPQINLKNVTVILNDNVPKVTNKDIIIGLNKEMALTKYVAAGSQINEIAKNIRNQTQLGTISEIVGFSKFLDTASRVMKTT